MKAVLLFLAVMLSVAVNAQLKTKVLKGKLGDSTISYHQNGKISIINYKSDPDFNIHTFIAYDNTGKQIFKGDHGYRHGGAGIYPKYYSNGQISSIRSTFQPDGGIQYYDVTEYWNEDGSYSHKEDNSRNTERETLHHVPTTPIVTPKEEKVQEVKIQTPDSTNLVIKNSTRKKVSIIVANKQNDKIYVYKLKRNQELNIGKFLQKKGELNPKNYFVVNLDSNDPKSKNYSVVWISDVSTIKKSVLMLIDISELT